MRTTVFAKFGKMRKKCYCLFAIPLAIICIFCNIQQTFAALPAIIPREVLFGNPARFNPQISPDGKYISYVAPDKNNILQVWIRTVDKNDDRVLTTDKKSGITSYAWDCSSEQIIYSQDIDGNEVFHLFALGINSAQVRNLTPNEGVRAGIIAGNCKFPNEILISKNLQDRRRFDVYRLNLQTGKSTLETENPGNTLGFIPDSQLRIRATLLKTDDGGSALAVRGAANKPWTTIRQWEPNDAGSPVGFSEDGQTLYLVDNKNSNTTRLLAFNLKTGKESIIAQDQQYDFGGAMVKPMTDKIEAVAFNKEKVEWKILDKSIEADFQTLSKVRRGQFSIVSRDLADKNWVVAYSADNSPTYFYKYDRATKKSQFLFTNRPQLEGVELAQMSPISYQSRDGLTIHGYLTTPNGIPAKNLPMVLLVHGGPWIRDSWGFNSEVQWLANRGYAVLQVNFRGSAGYGKEFLNAGNREWGGKMHDDLIDGVNWIVKQGIANPKKISIMGGSYGGYATLVGLTFTPDVFAAGVSMYGPSNLETLLQNLPPEWELGRDAIYRRIGNLETEPDFLKSRSPLFFVDRIKAPLLIGQGANDPRVKQSESEQIVTAMRKANKPVQYILYSDEGHGFARPQNRLHFYAQVEDFLGKYLGGRIELKKDIPGHSGVIR